MKTTLKLLLATAALNIPFAAYAGEHEHMDHKNMSAEEHKLHQGMEKKSDKEMCDHKKTDCPMMDKEMKEHEGHKMMEGHKKHQDPKQEETKH